jgi:RecB family exonuclease
MGKRLGGQEAERRDGAVSAAPTLPLTLEPPVEVSTKAPKRPRKAPQPRLPRFSPTRIDLYLFCPRAYHLYYDRGLKWGGMSAGYAFGGSLHRTLQVFHERGGAENVSVDELLDQLRERWSDAGYGTAEEADAHLQAGQALLEQYHSRSAEPGRETLWTEKTVQHRYEEFVLFGKVDRLDRRPDGALEVVDYKSGRLTVTEEEVRGSLTLAIYQLLVARANPGTPVYTGIFCVRSCQSAAVLRTAEELDAVEREVTEVVRRILRDEEKRALPGRQCRDCAYPRVCPPGRQWLRENAPWTAPNEG